MWAQKYEHLPDYTTLAEKKLFRFSVAALFACLTWLPLWALAWTPAEINFLQWQPEQVVPAIQRADSLFASGQFEAATPLYKAQVWQHRRASADLLLKLAYAQQQLGHYPAALLYLSLAQARQPQVRTWRQQVALATQHRLVGYPATCPGCWAGTD